MGFHIRMDCLFFAVIAVRQVRPRAYALYILRYSNGKVRGVNFVIVKNWLVEEKLHCKMLIALKIS
jgi:hypothetical protein